MAIEYKEVKDRLYNNPLTELELREIEMLEEYIDKKIVEEYKGKDMHFSFNDFRFTGTGPHDFIDYSKSSPRANLQREELATRYDKSGWEIILHQDDGLDGPNMSGPDYWIFRGKKD